MNLSFWLLLWFAGSSAKTLGEGGGDDTKEQKTLQLPCQETSPQLVIRRSARRRTSSTRNRKRSFNGKLKSGIKRLRAEMTEISEEQKCIKEGQRQVREKYEEIEAERKRLWKETELIAKQSAGIQLKLNLMFKLLKARAQNDTALVAQLTHSLRDLVAKQNEQIQ